MSIWDIVWTDTWDKWRKRYRNMRELIYAKVKQHICSKWTGMQLWEPTHGSTIWLPVGKEASTTGFSVGVSQVCVTQSVIFVWWVNSMMEDRSCCHVSSVCMKDLAWRRLFLSTSRMCEVCQIVTMRDGLSASMKMVDNGWWIMSWDQLKTGASNAVCFNGQDRTVWIAQPNRFRV